MICNYNQFLDFVLMLSEQEIPKPAYNYRYTQVLSTLVRPTGFEPAAFRVGVIRRPNEKALRPSGLVGFGQICGELQKNPGGIAVQCLRGFFR